MIDAWDLKEISKTKPPETNISSLVDALNQYGAIIGLDQPHRLAHFIAQIMHESGGLKYNKEIWGPTAAQKRYEGRKDLGNTHKGDGSKYRGYGLIQVTGRANVTLFFNWCARQGMSPPDFISKPELIATAPWSAVSALWYWDMKNLNSYADRGDIENITRKINGGLNGYDDRISYYDRAALVLLGYGVKDILKFQKDHGVLANGISGPITRAGMHKALLEFTKKSNQSSRVQLAPVVEEVKVPVKLGDPEKPFWQQPAVIATTGAGGLVTTAVANVGTIPWQNLVVLVAAAFIGLVAYLVYERIHDKKKQEEKAQEVKS